MMPEVAKIIISLKVLKILGLFSIFVNRIFFYILFLLLNLATSGIMDVGSIGNRIFKTLREIIDFGNSWHHGCRQVNSRPISMD